jgi:hypothetical protein
MTQRNPEQLYEIAKDNKRKLTPRERREVIVWLDESDELPSNRELARVFQCDERLIRLDKQAIMREYAAGVTPDSAMGFVARYLKGHDDLIRYAKLGLDSSAPGGMQHEKYLKLLSDLELRRVKLLQDIGVIPKELGHLSIAEENWVAEVDVMSGITNVTRDKDA